MELSWPINLRIAAVVITGVVLIGILAWPVAAPYDPLGAVRFNSLSHSGAIILVLLAFCTGFIAYFVSWPHGREIGVLAVPSGLAIWAGRSGSMAELMQLSSNVPQRQALFASLKWESFFWLIIIAAGFAGVLLGQKIRSKSGSDDSQGKSGIKSTYLNPAAAIIGSAVIAYFCMKILAQDFTTSDNTVVAQPALSQIVFAVLASFIIASFVVNKFFKTGRIWPIIASALVTTYAVTAYAKQNVLQSFLANWPATFFPNSIVSILPVQMVSFGTLGSIVGCWLAIRYTHNRQHRTT